MPLPSLVIDFSGAVQPEWGVSEAKLAALSPALARVRSTILERDQNDQAAGFIHRPDRLLSAYQQERAASELGRIMSAAARLREKVDRVVVLGSGASLLGAEALRDACCQPYFNELSRGERGGYPRIYFAGNHLDNDALQGLLHLLGNGRPAASRDDHWGLVVIDESGESPDSLGAFKQFFATLRSSYGGYGVAAAERVISITTDASRVNEQMQILGCRDRFTLPTGAGGTGSVLSAVGLIPAALMGLDILKLLEGAKAMNDHFRTAPPLQNRVLQLAGLAQLLERKEQAFFRRLCLWAKSLETTGRWCAQLLAERLGKVLISMTADNLREFLAQAGDPDSLWVNLLVDEWRFDPLFPPPGEDFSEGFGKSLPERWTAAIQDQNQIRLSRRQPVIDLHLPGTTAHAFGQFFQCWMLSAEAEGGLREG
jgi:glucose-6-phosphate isomerase